MEAEIGQDWTKRVKRHGYAGVKIKDLADSMGYAQLYVSTYKLSSSGVHASDAMNHLHHEEGLTKDPSYFAVPHPSGVANTLGFASLLVIKIFRVADDRLNLGITEKAAEFLEKAKGMTLEFPED